mmetsp:Transcript_17333/g.30942  ORF Transcript_17333/g.30942 Transcript_17333/m.30942 type:complete len:217 (-) Transcript_17333:872-1522(-)
MALRCSSGGAVATVARKKVGRPFPRQPPTRSILLRGPAATQRRRHAIRCHRLRASSQRWCPIRVKEGGQVCLPRISGWARLRTQAVLVALFPFLALPRFPPRGHFVPLLLRKTGHRTLVCAPTRKLSPPELKQRVPGRFDSCVVPALLFTPAQARVVYLGYVDPAIPVHVKVKVHALVGWRSAETFQPRVTSRNVELGEPLWRAVRPIPLGKRGAR